MISVHTVHGILVGGVATVGLSVIGVPGVMSTIGGVVVGGGTTYYMENKEVNAKSYEALSDFDKDQLRKQKQLEQVFDKEELTELKHEEPQVFTVKKPGKIKNSKRVKISIPHGKGYRMPGLKKHGMGPDFVIPGRKKIPIVRQKPQTVKRNMNRGLKGATRKIKKFKLK